MKEPLYIEFVGLPGAGKSTVGKEVIAQLNARGYRCVVQGMMGHRVVTAGASSAHAGRDWRPRSSWERALGYLLLHLRLRRVVAAALPHPAAAGRFWRMIRPLRVLLLACQRIRNARDTVGAGRGDLILFDQGIVHPLREIVAGDSPRAEVHLRGLLHAILEAIAPTRLIFVLFDLEPETALVRLRQRGVALGRYARLGPEEARRELAIEAPGSSYILDSFAAFPAVAGVLRVDATRPAAELAEEVAGYLLRQLEPAELAARPTEEGAGERRHAVRSTVQRLDRGGKR